MVYRGSRMGLDSTSSGRMMGIYGQGSRVVAESRAWAVFLVAACIIRTHARARAPMFAYLHSKDRLVGAATNYGAAISGPG
jgi:hypothetical protein